jgi:integrase
MPHSGRRRTGLNVARKRRADGSVIEYFYDAKTKEFLGHDRAAAEARVKGATQAELAPDTIAALIQRYRASPAYRKLKPGTKALYDRYLDQIKQAFGDCRAKEIRPGTIEDIKDRLQSTPSKANMWLALFRILLRLAVRLEYIPSNPAARPGRIETNPRTEIWTHKDEDRFLAEARDSLKLGFALMLYTCQRLSDVLSMSTDHISERDGRMFIAVKQAKTSALLDIPVHSRLRPLVEARLAAAKHGNRLGPSPRGLNWSRRNFSRAWDQTMKKADLSGLQRRDLRRSGVVRMAEVGLSPAQIAAITGHGVDYCMTIIDTYLPRRTEVAVTAIETWERADRKNQSTVVQLVTKRRTA